MFGIEKKDVVPEDWAKWPTGSKVMYVYGVFIIILCLLGYAV